MIRNSRSIPAMIFLFLNFLFISRYIQQIIFDDDLSNTFLHRLSNKRNVCEPHTDSILGQYKSNNKRILFVMLDSYPQETLYKKLVGKNSKIHDFLKENSSEYIETTTPIAYTYKSLPYLLGKIDVKTRNCRFPFLRGFLKPNLILASNWSSSNESICSEYVKHQNYFLRISQVIKKRMNNLPKSKWWVPIDTCYLSSKYSPDQIKLQMKNQRFNKRNISFIVEEKFHDLIDPNLTGKEPSIKLISTYDTLYYNSIKKLVNDVFEEKLADEIIIMNDHGPRTKLWGELPHGRNKISDSKLANTLRKLTPDSFLDKDYYGVFLAKFDSNRNINTDKFVNTKFLKRFLPETKERYVPAPGGKAIYLKTF